MKIYSLLFSEGQAGEAREPSHKIAPFQNLGAFGTTVFSLVLLFRGASRHDTATLFTGVFTAEITGKYGEMP